MDIDALVASLGSPLDGPEGDGGPSVSVSAWRICTEPELQDAIRAGFRGGTTRRQSDLLSAWVWARVMDHEWKTMDDLLGAYRESFVEVEDDIHAA